MRLEIISKTPTTLAHPTPLLFVHGAWHGAWCWDEYFLDDFARHGYAVHALSLRGHGGSEGRERLRWTRVADYVADVDQVVKQLAAPPVIIGHSMGGLITQKYLESHSAPAAVLLASVPPGGVLATTLRLALRHPIEFIKVNATLSLFPLVATPALAQESFFSSRMPAAQAQKFFQKLQDESFLGFLDMLMLNLPRPRRVQTPMLVLGAADDTVFHPHEVEATAQTYHTQATIFPNMAHDMMLEEGWQSVAEVIRKWLNEKGI